jgi:peptidoglycan/xylan/chitin deacetylase (PgdA/CDA1 family)
MRREVFAAVGGFDTRFAAAGTYGNEDLDIGYRIAARGFRVAFNPRAISYQFYATPAAVNLRQYRNMGHADVAFARKHPELADHLFHTIRNETREHRRLRGPVLRFPRLAGLLVALLRDMVTVRVDRGCGDRWTARIFFTMRTAEYWRGVDEAGGIPSPQPVRVLCYHAVADLAGDPVLADYGVPEETLRHQIESLMRWGYRFISAGELVRMLESRGGVPRRSVLITFDDAYCSLLTSGLPILRGKNVPALTFAVTGEIGGTNRWDHDAGARALPLLDIDGLKQCLEAGIDVGAHSRTHRSLPTLEGAELEAEIAGSVSDLEHAGLPRPDLFAYPFGEHDVHVRRAARAAGLRVAFTVDPGLVRPGDDPYALRRFEIYPSDRGLLLRLRVATAGRIPLMRAALRAELWRRKQRARRLEP